MAEVAARARVSIATVSRALNTPGLVSEALARRVHAAADSLGYRPNPIAGTLAGARAPIVGVVVPSVTNSFFSGTLQAMSSPLADAGYQIMLGHHEYDLAREEALIGTFLTWRPAALVTTGLHHTRRGRTLLARAECPVVEMWALGRRPVDSAVGFSNRLAGALAARHLLERRRHHLAYVGAIMERDPRAEERMVGFREAVAAAAGSEPRVHRAADRVFTAGGDAVRALLETGRPLDGIAFSSDVLALGALFELERRGIAVPDDIALVGYGDLEFAACSNPSLTTVRPPRDRIGTEVAAHLVARLGGGDLGRAVVDLGCELVPRGTT
ncbi:MAG: LacI family DNA-binding transcriptional regulator [Ectothiorhodospiraceae bacterium]|nr:LacI family DNA-binding transcriptional regulator [Chromatiales bacterium]MCP5154932.1 LacI family DNA-binding transcriptional regulator [Ectothiorhodospiraceae bacterium]